jgi:glycosyltransferase involved in cell wall biosynthesis
MKLSVIVPVAPFENISPFFTDRLCDLPAGSEIIFVFADSNIRNNIKIKLPGIKIKLISAKPQRANCLNAGALCASGDFLWFLHADSKLNENNISFLLKAINQNPDALLYFYLAFEKGSPLLMKLNEWGAFFRSRCLDTPFGDQGLCIKKDLYNFLGGYNEDVPYGEDHLFVRNVRRKKIQVIPVGTPLFTSARKYIKNGWFRTTVNHLFLWQKQIYYDIIKHRKKGIS